jgi:hypothetical protein
MLISSVNIQAQSYRFSPYPDLWYNDVDGIRLGLRILGEVDGTFKDGPHRLDAGIWVGSKIPENPVSYYVSFTEPLNGISDFGSEGNIQLISSSRTGYSMHQLRFNKRWQNGFDDLDYFEASLYGSYEKNYDLEYRFNSKRWYTDWKSIFGSSIIYSRAFNNVRTESGIQLIRELDQGFNSISFESKNTFQINENYSFRARVFIQNTNTESYGEYFSYLWTNSPINWLQNGFNRANGTIPESWLENNSIQYGGGPNLRGFIEHEVEGNNRNASTTYETVYGLNIEFVFPNPIENALNKNQILGDIIDFESYLFFDAGGGLNESTYFNEFTILPSPLIEDTGTLMDAGLGFQFSANIPDYLGKDRGIFIRYDIPLWLSSTVNNESNFKYRNVVGIGAIFNF